MNKLCTSGLFQRCSVIKNIMAKKRVPKKKSNSGGSSSAKRLSGVARDRAANRRLLPTGSKRRRQSRFTFY